MPEVEKQSLTKSYCSKAKYRFGGSNKRDIRWDSRTPGFGLRVYPSGKKSFVIGYRAPDNRYRFKTITAFSEDSPVDVARAEARKQLGEVLSGVDPLETARQRRRAATVAEFSAVYMKRHARVHKKSADKDQYLFDKYINPAFGSRKLQALSRSDVLNLHQSIGKELNNHSEPKQTQANRVLSLISKMFNLAVEWLSLIHI